MAKPYEKVTHSSQFRATVVITGTETYKQANERGYFDDPRQIRDFDTVEIKLTAGSLDELRTRLISHLNLLEDQ